MNRTALTLGATGGIGGEVSRALLSDGWTVRALHRKPERVREPHDRLEWIKGDALDSVAVKEAARGVSLLVHGVNPPGYKGWDKVAVPMLENSIAACRAAGARIFFPGTIYNFGPETFPLVAEDAPQSPRTRKGLIRVDMERRLLEASRSGLKVLVLRAGDWFGPRTTRNSWFKAAMVRPGRVPRRVIYPGDPETGHAWAYLPDVAETVVQLLRRADELEGFAAFHFDGHWFERGGDMATEIGHAVGNPDIPVRRFPWVLARACSPFSETLREMLEMRYLWLQPARLDNRKLVAFLGAEPHTATGVAVRSTLAGLGCLPALEGDERLASGEGRE